MSLHATVANGYIQHIGLLDLGEYPIMHVWHLSRSAVLGYSGGNDGACAL
jgi:hypothetical protein